MEKRMFTQNENYFWRDEINLKSKQYYIFYNHIRKKGTINSDTAININSNLSIVIITSPVIMPRRKKGSHENQSRLSINKEKPQQRYAANARERARMRVLSRWVLSKRVLKMLTKQKKNLQIYEGILLHLC